MPAKVITGWRRGASRGAAGGRRGAGGRAAACAAVGPPAEGRRLAPPPSGRHACRVSQRTLMLIGLSLLIAALTLFVSRKFGFTFLFLPLFFAWGGGRGQGS